MMHSAWSSIVEVPYCFSRSYIKFQGHTALKIVEFDPNWEFPNCNSNLNSPMAMKCCTKLETAKERCPNVFQGHPSNFKVTPVFKISAGPRTLTGKIWVGPASFPFLSYINFRKIVLRSGKFQILFWRLSHGTKHHRFWPKLGVSGL